MQTTVQMDDSNPYILVSKHPRVLEPSRMAGLHQPSWHGDLVTDRVPKEEAQGKGPCITMKHWFHDV